MRFWSLPEFRTNETPARGTSSRVLLRFEAWGREIILRQTVIEPGGSSGWHYHDGTLFVLVTKGTLDHPDARLAPIAYRRPRLFRERGGPRYAHVARNRGTGPVAITVLYVNPVGAPLSRAVASPEG
ncbi:cupin domain-containing protein [Nocardia bovistercoris]|uniref:Cupin domain-containing protein n=1 Tax=Nocardia bovistercoris TaxID=2785916 RepID=A0A931IBP5_9NOCA|nr:hypothetical protein [Nocardia bovistercoris]MBH0778662.1 hypothetical protein [Nocardia bovistercoris]